MPKKQKIMVAETGEPEGTGKAKAYEPTNSELMDPGSPYFTLEWWQICEITPPDPWAYIVSDFQWSAEFLYYALGQELLTEETDIGHYPQSSKPSDRLTEALSIALQLQDDLTWLISTKSADLEFAWKWGEYQKAMAIIYATKPRLENQVGMTFHSKNSAEIKFRARQWYALWLEDYRELKNNPKISRETFNPVFAKILSQMHAGAIFIPDKNREDILALIEATLSKKLGVDGKAKLTRHFTVEFWSDAYDLALAEANKNKSTLPPYGKRNFQHPK